MVRFFCAVLALWEMRGYAYPVPVDINGEVSRWPIDPDQPDIYFEVRGETQASASSFAPMVTEAAQMWSDVPEAYIRLQPLPAGSTAHITVEFVTSINSDVSAGYAHFDSFDNGKPSHCSIKVAASPGDLSESLSRTVLHELGHCLGLGHSVMPEAVMSYSLDRNGYHLSIDDEAALARLYPEGEEETKLPPGCAIGSGSFGIPLKKRYLMYLLIVPFVFLFFKRLQL